MLRKIQIIWQFVRRLSGDDAYERYLSHFADHYHPGCRQCDEQPLTKKAYFKQCQDEKWNGVKRCC